MPPVIEDEMEKEVTSVKQSEEPTSETGPNIVAEKNNGKQAKSPMKSNAINPRQDNSQVKN